MTRYLTPLLAAALITVSPSLVADDDFSASFAARSKADISFAQLMQIMQRATSMILDGILAENKEMTVLGAHLLDAHPAPAQGPGVAIVPEQREAFKNVMPAYDKVFHSATERLSLAASQGQWPQAYAGYREIMDGCMACHETWRPHALSRQQTAGKRP